MEEVIQQIKRILKDLQSFTRIYGKSTKEDEDDNVYTNLNCSNEQVTDKSKYNNTCPQRFMTDKRFPDSDGCDRGWPVDKGMLNWFKMLCMWLKIDSDR